MKKEIDSKSVALSSGCCTISPNNRMAADLLIEYYQNKLKEKKIEYYQNKLKEKKLEAERLLDKIIALNEWSNGNKS